MRSRDRVQVSRLWDRIRDAVDHARDADGFLGRQKRIQRGEFRRLVGTFQQHIRARRRCPLRRQALPTGLK
jgi:hypothetical protein